MQTEEVLYAILSQVSQGNPGAITVIKMLMETFPSEFMNFVEKMLQLSLVGSELWVKYKECNKDLQCLAEYLRTH